MVNKSLVFKAVFQHFSKYDSDNTCNIKDFKPEIVKQMICFIYTNKLAEDPTSFEKPGWISGCGSHTLTVDTSKKEVQIPPTNEEHRKTVTVLWNQTWVSLGQNRVPSPLGYKGGITLGSFLFYLNKIK